MNALATTIGWAVMIMGGAAVCLAVLWGLAEIIWSQLISAARLADFMAWKRDRDRARRAR